MKPLLLVAGIHILSASLLYAQKVSISKVELAGSKIIVHYDLDDSNPNAEYLLHLYSSKDNFGSPLAKVSGAVGAGVKPGTNQRMEWNAAEEIGAYKGKLSLEIKGRVYIPVVKLESFDTKKTYKRGKSYQLVWRSGDPSSQIHIELYKGGERVTGERNLANNGNYTLHIPAGTKSGKDYRLKFTNARNADEIIYSGNFQIAPKIPLLLKLLPVAVVGGAAVFLGGSEGGNGNGNGGERSNEIPLPGFPGN